MSGFGAVVCANDNRKPIFTYGKWLANVIIDEDQRSSQASECD